MLEERRQFEPLLEALLAELVVTHAVGQARHQLGLDAVPADDRNRDALRFLEDCRKGPSPRWCAQPPRLAWSNASLKSSLVDGAMRKSRPGVHGSSRRWSSSAWRISCGFSSRSRITWPNMSHSHLREPKTHVLVGQQCCSGGELHRGRGQPRAQPTQPACSAGCRSPPRRPPSQTQILSLRHPSALASTRPPKLNRVENRGIG